MSASGSPVREEAMFDPADLVFRWTTQFGRVQTTAVPEVMQATKFSITRLPEP